MLDVAQFAKTASLEPAPPPAPPAIKQPTLPQAPRVSAVSKPPLMQPQQPSMAQPPPSATAPVNALPKAPSISTVLPKANIPVGNAGSFVNQYTKTAMPLNLAQFAKVGYMDPTDPVSATASGEAKNVGFKLKPDDHAQGQDAWDATAGYLKGSKKKDTSSYDPRKNMGLLGKVALVTNQQMQAGAPQVQQAQGLAPQPQQQPAPQPPPAQAPPGPAGAVPPGQPPAPAQQAPPMPPPVPAKPPNLQMQPMPPLPVSQALGKTAGTWWNEKQARNLAGAYNTGRNAWNGIKGWFGRGPRPNGGANARAAATGLGRSGRVGAGGPQAASNVAMPRPAAPRPTTTPPPAGPRPGGGPTPPPSGGPSGAPSFGSAPRHANPRLTQPGPIRQAWGHARNYGGGTLKGLGQGFGAAAVTGNPLLAPVFGAAGMLGRTPWGRAAANSRYLSPLLNSRAAQTGGGALTTLGVADFVASTPRSGNFYTGLDPETGMPRGVDPMGMFRPALAGLTPGSDYSNAAQHDMAQIAMLAPNPETGRNTAQDIGDLVEGRVNQTAQNLVANLGTMSDEQLVQTITSDPQLQQTLSQLGTAQMAATYGISTQEAERLNSAVGELMRSEDGQNFLSTLGENGGDLSDALGGALADRYNPLAMIDGMFNNIIGGLGMGETQFGQYMSALPALMKGLVMASAIALPITLLARSRVGLGIAGLGLATGLGSGMFMARPNNTTADEAAGADDAAAGQASDTSAATNQQSSVQMQDHLNQIQTNLGLSPDAAGTTGQPLGTMQLT